MSFRMNIWNSLFLVHSKSYIIQETSSKQFIKLKSQSNWSNRRQIQENILKSHAIQIIGSLFLFLSHSSTSPFSFSLSLFPKSPFLRVTLTTLIIMAMVKQTVCYFSDEQLDLITYKAGQFNKINCWVRHWENGTEQCLEGTSTIEKNKWQTYCNVNWIAFRLLFS